MSSFTRIGETDIPNKSLHCRSAYTREHTVTWPVVCTQLLSITEKTSLCISCKYEMKRQAALWNKLHQNISALCHIADVRLVFYWPLGGAHEHFAGFSKLRGTKLEKRPVHQEHRQCFCSCGQAHALIQVRSHSGSSPEFFLPPNVVVPIKICFKHSMKTKTFPP